MYSHHTIAEAKAVYLHAHAHTQQSDSDGFVLEWFTVKAGHVLILPDERLVSELVKVRVQDFAFL